MKKIIFNFLVFTLLLTNLFVSYKLYRSSILQSVILKDYNNRTFSITPDVFDKFDISFPNISQTTVPMKLLKGRYYRNIDSIQTAIRLFKESIELNPYLMMAEENYLWHTMTYKNLIALIIMAKKRSTHYLIIILIDFHIFNHWLIERDSIELDNAFELIKNRNSKDHWINYMLSETLFLKSILNI